MKKIIGIIVVIILIGLGFWFFTKSSTETVDFTETNLDDTPQEEAVEEIDRTPATTVLGKSVDGRDITAYHYYGSEDADTELLFVGGVHGGYSWNTVLVAYELMDYLDGNTDDIPANVKVTVVPVMNPDGLYEVVGTDGRFDASDVPQADSKTVAGRFNENDVDLNRNFDCEWSATSKWQNRTVSGGDDAFSEPEAQAMRDYVMNHDIDGALVWYSAAGGVFASSCDSGSASTKTRTLTKLYADASGYKAYESFDFYEITGDMVNWFAKRDIPAISVLLTTHDDVEWSENRKGIEAMFELYADDSVADDTANDDVTNDEE